jgi:predicted HicB family RNase H-like nuclease
MTMGSNHMHNMLRGNKKRAEEYAKYENNPVAFLEDHFYGFDAFERKPGKLKLFDFQKEMLNMITSNKFSMFMHSRQMFTSTLLAGYCAHQILFNFDFKILFIGNSAACSERFLKTVREILKRYDTGAFVYDRDVDIDNKREIILHNGNKIIAKPPSIDAARGENVNLVIYDEYAFVNDNIAEGIYLSLQMAISCIEGAKMIMNSAAGYEGCFFDKLWNQSVEGKNEFATKKIHYSRNPYFTEERIEQHKKTLNYDEKVFNQEYEMIPQKPIKNKRINLRITDELYEDAKKRAKSLGVSLSTYITMIIQQDLNS